MTDDNGLRAALAGFVNSLTNFGRNRETQLSVNHDELRLCVVQAQAALATPEIATIGTHYGNGGTFDPSVAGADEPVAWMIRKSTGDLGGIVTTNGKRLTDDEKLKGWTETPLYAHPPATQPTGMKLISGGSSLSQGFSEKDIPPFVRDVPIEYDDSDGSVCVFTENGDHVSVTKTGKIHVFRPNDGKPVSGSTTCDELIAPATQPTPDVAAMREALEKALKLGKDYADDYAGTMDEVRILAEIATIRAIPLPEAPAAEKELPPIWERMQGTWHPGDDA